MSKVAVGILVGGKLMVSSRLLSSQSSCRAEVVGKIWGRARSKAGKPSFWFFVLAACPRCVCDLVCYRAQQTFKNRDFEDVVALTSNQGPHSN